MKNYNYILWFLVLYTSYSYSQSKNVKILFSLNENYKTIIEDDKFYYLDTIFFEKPNKKLYFLNNAIYFNKEKIYCFNNVSYYEDLIYVEINKIKYLYIYPHYINRIGPYIWYDLGVLIKFGKKIIIKEDIDYYDNAELWRITKVKKYKFRNLKNKTCADGSLP